MSDSVHFFRRYLLHILFLLAAGHLVAGTDHIVGANRGWNPGINYTGWVNNQTFYVNDFISFRYQKSTYNVFMVNESGYDNCTIEGAAGNWSSGKDFILLDQAKRYYFIGGNGFCFSGMKVSVVVHPLPSPPASKSAGSGKGEEKSGAPFALGGLVVLKAVFGVLVGLAWI